MKKIAVFLLICMLGVNTVHAQTMGGPDTYGYIWRDSNDPLGQPYNWIDILPLPGAQKVRFLADDNTVGSFPIGFPFHYYWYDVTQFWVGSNGYIGFANGQLSSPFPMIPSTSGPENFLAAQASDLLFDISNSAECWRYTNPAQDTLIVSWLNVPFYDATSTPGIGNNTFQIILSAVDSSITYQYKVQTGAPATGVSSVIGIENISGGIGLQHSFNILPPINYAVKFYYPSSTTYTIADASTDYNDNVVTGGLFRSKSGAPFTMISDVKNTGNLNLSPFNVFSRVYNSSGIIQAYDSIHSIALTPGQSQTITMGTTYNPTTAGTFRYITGTQLAGDPLPVNDQKVLELVVVDTTAPSIRLSFDNGVEAGLGGLNWTGGVGGAAIYFIPPFYPCKVTDLLSYIVANPNNYGFSMSVFDDNGSGGTAGTQLDSVYIPASSVITGAWNAATLSTPITITSGGVYVAWQMNGVGLTLGQNQVGPFSNRTFEILGNTWATYRFRETEDVMININIAKAPVSGAGIEEKFLDNYFGNFYPIPSLNSTVLDYSLPFSIKQLSYEIYDIEGKLIEKSSLNSQGSTGKIVLNVTALNSGMYYCKINADGNNVIRKLVIAK
ncbi:MAG: T9SS type A sorting domain-containing protein [Bacteroidia bacterium]